MRLCLLGASLVPHRSHLDRSPPHPRSLKILAKVYIIAIRAFLAPSLGAYGFTLGQLGVEICRFGVEIGRFGVEMYRFGAEICSTALKCVDLALKCVPRH